MRWKKEQEKVVGSTIKDFRIRGKYYYCERCQRGEFIAGKELGLKGLFTESLEHKIVLTGVHQPFNIAAKLINMLVGGSKVSISTIRRHTLKKGKEVEKSESSYNENWGIKAEEEIKVGIDGCMVLTREEGWKEVKVGVMEGKGRKRYIGKCGGPEMLGESLLGEWRKTGASLSGKKISLGDGAPWIWNLVKSYIPCNVEIVDWYHAAQHIYDCAKELYGEGNTNEQKWAEKMKTVLWSKGADKFMDVLYVEENKTEGTKKAHIDDLYKYVMNNRERMNYPVFEENGYPVGSGMVESACKQFVQLRMKRSGCRWNKDNVNRMLAIRAIYMSNLDHKLYDNCPPK